MSAYKKRFGTAGAALALVIAPLCAAASRDGGQVKVEILEKVPAGSELEPGAQEPIERYSEPAFAFIRIPAKYSGNAIPLDRSNPFVLRATYERALPAGEHQFRLRARGAARLLVDGKELLKTKPQPPNRSGDDPVPPPVVRDKSPVRPAPYPHQDAVATVSLEAGIHQFTLVAIIGGKGLAPPRANSP